MDIHEQVNMAAYTAASNAYRAFENGTADQNLARTFRQMMNTGTYDPIGEYAKTLGKDPAFMEDAVQAALNQAAKSPEERDALLKDWTAQAASEHLARALEAVTTGNSTTLNN